MSEHVPPGPPATPPPPGWYPDPGVAGQLRFWDGRGWTDQVSVPQPTGPPTGPAAGPPTGPAAGPAAGSPFIHAHQPTPARGPGCAGVAGIVLLSLVLLFAVLVGIAKLFGGGSVYDEQSATTACEFFVRSRLQAPGSADFTDVEVTEGAADEWTVTGAVDSRSAGGTTERTTFVCVVSPGPNGSGLQLDRLRFEGP